MDAAVETLDIKREVFGIETNKLTSQQTVWYQDKQIFPIQKWDQSLNSNLFCALVSETEQENEEVFLKKKMWFRNTKTIDNLPSVDTDITDW